MQRKKLARCLSQTAWIACFLLAPVAASAQTSPSDPDRGRSVLDNAPTTIPNSQRPGIPAASRSNSSGTRPAGATLSSNNIRAARPVITRVEAYAGRPYGIGKISYRLRDGDQMIDRTGATLLTEKRSRILYPVSSRPAAAKFFQNLTGQQTVEPDSIHTVWFLFQGDDPLEITLIGSMPAHETVPVEYVNDRKFQRIVKQWWREYIEVAEKQREWGDYPPYIETYLTSMLSRRLGLPLPPERKRPKDPLGEALSLLFNTESNLDQAIRSAMLGQADLSPANMPLPPMPPWQMPEFGEFEAEGVTIEPIARCVPRECFYLRFGKWQNQLWFKRLSSEFGGNLGRMISLRGFESKIESKFLNQLAIESSEFDDLFGGSLISDVAVIGNDFYFDNGASLGVLLQSTSTAALQRRLTSRREKFAKDHAKDGCQVEMIEVDGVPVQFLRTPDNRYRSFYVVAGDTHMVASSLNLVRRFLEASKGQGSIVDSLSFRFARYNMPVEHDHTIFIFLPPELFQRLLGPEYQIEARRRNRSVADMQMVELAWLAARAEGYGDVDVAELIEMGFLPEGFGNRPDGSQLTRVGENWIDSIRGRRGFFSPIPDVEIVAATQQEIEEYQARARYFLDKVPGIDPMFVGIKRYERDDDVERVVIDARVAPFGQNKYKWLLSMLGPPMRTQVAESPREIVRISASLKGNSLFGDGQPHLFYAAVRDELDPTVDLKPTTLLRVVDLVKSAPGYVATTPNGGYLDWLPRLGGQPDPEGFTHSPLLGLWRLQTNEFSAISFDQQRLRQVKDELRLVPAKRPAHVRVEIGDLANSTIRDWVNSQNFHRSWQTSIANTRLLNTLIQQFKLKPEEALAVAERLLDVRLVCALDGQYKMLETNPGRLVWCSTNWPDFANPTMPPDYTAPLLKWFRGAQLEVLNAGSEFLLHGYIDIQREKDDSTLPSFNLFKGFGSILSGDSDENDDQPDK